MSSHDYICHTPGLTQACSLVLFFWRMFESYYSTVADSWSIHCQKDFYIDLNMVLIPAGLCSYVVVPGEGAILCIDYTL